MIDFNYYMPTKLLFGPGKVSGIGEITKQYGTRALIVTGKNSTKKTGLLDRVVSYLEKEDIECIIFDKVQSNPLTTTAEEGAIFAKEKGCDVVVALGGGSTIDAAKGIAFMAVNDGSVTDYIFGKAQIGALPIIAVTTTAGTGSEGDCMAVLTNPENNDKKSLKSQFIYPKVSIIDSELMTTLPKHIIAPTGIDVMCHAMEAYVAKNSNPLSEIMALKAIELVSKNLVSVYKNPNDLEAWSNMAFANTLGGMVIDASGVALAHGLEHPVSGLLDVTHGEGLAALLITWMEYTYESSLEKFANIAKAIGEDVGGLSIEDSAKKGIEGIKKLLARLDLTKTLSDLGVKEEHIDWLSSNALKTMTYAVNNNPKVPSLEEIKKLYTDCL
ncbi:iron-containing alcohol dehydrogenase [Clostridium magnum]|uniref:1,3-propanediol dehydrogenase n=1 Tax=Clostridium magnum DSM 2767 TaxID=1121326 RepID=A0A162R290_9CLOT|nr:1,3-propanediol dehydrogenase [Clostridium magnum DSM 2767]SHJ08396.1 Alcohol dehydrogenase, class IV [Clostridium magnum DSM 2767]